MTIAEIVRNTLTRLKTQGSSMLPDEYARIFCEEAKKKGVNVPECQKLATIIGKLDPSIGKLIRNYTIRTLEELTQFLAAQLSREIAGRGEDQTAAYRNLTLSLVKSLMLLHDADAAQLAHVTATRLWHPDIAQLARIKEEWDDFSRSYSDVFLEKLAPFGKLRSHDLKLMVEDLAVWWSHNDPEVRARPLVALMVSALQPVLSLEYDDGLRLIEDQLSRAPKAIYSDKMHGEIARFVERRTLLERKWLRDELKVLGQIVDLLQDKISDSVASSQQINDNIAQIRSEVMRISHGELANKELFVDLKERLLELVERLEGSHDKARESLKGGAQEVGALAMRIAKLEAELEKARQDSDMDFLTKLYNRRAVEREMGRLANLHDRHGTDFSVIFLDLDHFKSINDTYGHEAGDVVIRSFAQILKKHLRDEDISGRWGGEEFIILLPQTGEEGAYQLAERLRKAVEHTRFLYKNERIPVTVSGSVSSYGRYRSMEAMIATAIRLLYDAKERGRNRIERDA